MALIFAYTDAIGLNAITPLLLGAEQSLSESGKKNMITWEYIRQMLMCTYSARLSQNPANHIMSIRQIAVASVLTYTFAGAGIRENGFHIQKRRAELRRITKPAEWLFLLMLGCCAFFGIMLVDAKTPQMNLVMW